MKDRFGGSWGEKCFCERRIVMKTCRSKFKAVFSILMTICMLGTIFSYAESGKIQKDFKLGVNVNAQWQASGKILTVYGAGKIENEKWEAMAKVFGSDNFGDNGAWITNNHFTIVFADKTIQFPDDTAIGRYGFFEGFQGEIILPGGLDTSNITNMFAMFRGTGKANPDVSNWNTANVKNMSAMFADTVSANPDVSRWNVANVSDMSGMFSDARAADPDVQNWYPMNLKNMENMFSAAQSITEIDLSRWGKLKDMPASGVFSNMPSLKYLHFSGLDFGKGIGLNNFAGPYLVEKTDSSAKPEIIENPTQAYLFENNRSYKVSMLCNVKFDSNGGSPVESQRIAYGETASVPRNPVKYGYDFLYWELNGRRFDFNTPIKEHITLKAIWKSNGGTPTPPAPPAMSEIKAVVKVGSDILEKTVDGKKTKIKMDAVPFIEKGRIMLPLRYVAEALDMGVSWDNISKTVILKDKSNEVRIPIRSAEFTVNGQSFQSDVAPILQNGRTFLSLSNIAKPLGLESGKTIFWDNFNKTATFIRQVEK